MSESKRKTPKASFTELVLGLNSSALYYMGVNDENEPGPRAKINLPLAQQSIEFIESLQEKTKNNLEPEEAQILQQSLSDLRVRFARLSQGRPS